MRLSDTADADIKAHASDQRPKDNPAAEVWFVRVPYPGEPLPPGLSPLARKRRADWDDPGRNKFVTGSAAGVANRTRTTLR